MRRLALSAALGLALTVPAGATDESTATKIARAMSAGPAAIAQAATIADMDANGKTTTLRKGTNSYMCMPGHPGVVGDDPFCADAAAMQWTTDWMAHKPKPTTTTPGIVYMFAGGSDWSATDPWATKGTPIKEPPHWMITYPYQGASGLPTGIKTTGTWIMWAGTPYAHLMINQKP